MAITIIYLSDTIQGDRKT